MASALGQACAQVPVSYFVGAGVWIVIIMLFVLAYYAITMPLSVYVRTETADIPLSEWWVLFIVSTLLPFTALWFLVEKLTTGAILFKKRQP
jgi:hypothetical protein